MFYKLQIMLICQHDYSNFNEDDFVDDYSSLGLSMLHDDDASIDNKFNTFCENLSSLVDKHVPVRKMTRKEVKLHAKPWINQKIIKLIKYRDKLKRKMERKPTVDNKHLYKKFRNQVATELKASGSAYHNRYR